MMRPYGCLIQNPPSRVSELIDATSARWNVHRLQKEFLHIDIQPILSIPICMRNIQDSTAWNFEKKGIFTVRSAYNMLVSIRKRREAWLEGNIGSSTTNRESGDWKKLWHTQVPGKVRMFLWRLAKQSLPTNDVRAHRNMAQSSVCGLCGVQDSWRHSLLKCTSSRCTWALTEEEIGQKIAGTTEPSAKLWLFTMMNLLSHALFVKMAVTLWAIWSARRKAIHEGILQSPHCYSLVR